MKVILAGYNLDAEIIKELAKNYLGRNLTPETISAAYARISRDPRPVDQLRAAAREEVEKARRSNQNIIFNMGHHSVAEHAVFNFDIIGVSRLAVEVLEKFRLCSFTEKSQRYITLGRDYVVPQEIEAAGFLPDFEKLLGTQNDLYEKMFAKLTDYVFARNPELAASPKNKNLLEGWAKEDARYITALATSTQLGLTANARNLELIFRRFASHPLMEVQKLGQEIYRAVQKIAPSVILFVEANPWDAETYPALEKITRKFLAELKISEVSSEPEVTIIEVSPEAEAKIIAALLFKTSSAAYEECLKKARKLSPKEKEEILKTAFERLEFFDTLLREFELAQITFSLKISSACFAQLKRHRLATIIAQDYEPALGLTIPQSVIEAGFEKEFQKIAREAEELFYKLKPKIGPAAQYVLTNAHRRRVLFSTNIRELYHISRLREDVHAQWDIRNISSQMSDQAKKIMPLLLMLIGGKHEYHQIYEKVFGRPPKQKAPEN